MLLLTFDEGEIKDKKTIESVKILVIRWVSGNKKNESLFGILIEVEI